MHSDNEFCNKFGVMSRTLVWIKLLTMLIISSGTTGFKNKLVKVGFLSCSDFDERYLKLFVLTQKSRKRIVLYTSDADLLTYDFLGACTISFIHKS